jgi:effector-binding domain-containing protein
MEEEPMAEPTIVTREEQPYVALRGKVAMDEIGAFAHRLDEVASWMAARNVLPADAPFFKYDEIDMEAGIVLEIGYPTDDRHAGEDPIVSGVLPAGKYVSMTHRGHPAQLIDATRELLAWAKQQELEFDVDGNKWRCRLEIYKSDPHEVPDMNDWETELLIRLRD